MSIYRNPKFWQGLLDRLVRTTAQAGVAAVSVALFTNEGALAFALIIGVTAVGSILTSLAKPEAVLRGELPEAETSEPTQDADSI